MPANKPVITYQRQISRKRVKRGHIMGSAEKVSWKRVLILAGAIIAFTIGSGFATGQEIIQYYTAYGAKGLLVILVFMIAFLYYNFNFAKAGK